MDDLIVIAATKPWHYWIGVLMTPVSLAAVVGITIGYLRNVTALRYPKPQRKGRSHRRTTPTQHGVESSAHGGTAPGRSTRQRQSAAGRAA